MGVSQFGLTSFCIRLKGTTCVTCQLLRKGTKGTDIYILFLFLFNDVNGKKKKTKEITAPSMIHYSSSEI